jgi:hypothetical protein
VPHASAAPPPPPSLSSCICLILQCTHSPSLLHDTVDGMMAPPGSALYHQSLQRDLQLHQICVPPYQCSAKQGSEVDYSLPSPSIDFPEPRCREILSLPYIYSVSLHQHFNTSTLPLYHIGKPSKTTGATVSRHSLHSPTKKM